MSVGSKVVLLVSLGFIGFLIWFYGGLPDPTVELAGSASPGVQATPAVGATSEPTRSQAASTHMTPESPPGAAGTAQPDPSPSTGGTQQEREFNMAGNAPSETVTRPMAGPPGTVAEATPSPRSTRPHPNPTPSSSPGKPKKQVKPAAETPGTITKHVIASGETLSEISLRYYGSAIAWGPIVKANPGIDPVRLRVGMELKIPPKPATARTTPTMRTPMKPSKGTVHHTVESGDSLSSISERYYGKEYKWDIIFNANSTMLGGNPDRLKVGMVLVVPLES